MPPPPDGRRLRSAATRLEILDAAEVQFAARGFAETSIRSVALAAGLSAPGVARHFSDKEALFVEMLQRIQERNLDALNVADVATRPVPERLSLMVGRLVSRPDESILYTVLLGEARRPDHSAHGYLAGMMTGVSGVLDAAFGDEAGAIHAGWEGLRLLWLYLPERVDPQATLEYRMARVGSAEYGAADPAARRGLEAPVEVLRDGGAQDPAALPARIIAAAGRAFAEHGYRGARIRAIAADVGISHTTLIYHFPTKQALLRGVLDAGEPPEEPRIAAGAGLGFLRAIYELKSSGPAAGDLARVRAALAFEAIDASHPARGYFVDRYSRLLDRLERVYAGLDGSGLLETALDPELEALWTLALWEGLRIQSFYRSGVDEAELVRRELNRALRVSARVPKDIH